MGKIIRAQKIGKGKSRKSIGHRFKGEAKHLPLYTSKEEKVKGEVIDILHDPGRTAPLAKVRYENGKSALVIAPNKLKVGDTVSYGQKASPKLGNSLYVSQIPEGTLVYNVESVPGDGGKFGRAGGAFIKIVTHESAGTVIQLPSKVFKTVDARCRANIGVVSAGGRREKPFVKAGNKFYMYRTRGKVYPRVKGVAMNPTDHPFGGGGHPHIGKPKTVSRSTPPGRKVGSIAPRRTGKKR